MIAGLMDLLRTHALWLPSIRLAFHQTVVMSYEEVLSPQASHPLPCLADLAPVAAAAERAMAHVVQGMQGMGSAAAKPPPRGSVTALRAAMLGREALLEEAILAALHSRPLPRATASAAAAAAAGSDSDSVAVTVGAAVVEGEGEGEELSEEPSLLGNGGDVQGREQQEQQQGEAQQNEGGELPECLSGLSAALLQVFVRQAVANFLDNDLYWAAKKFLENAKGSFGMTTACTADCDRVVLAARNQPLALGFAPHSRTVLFSSESHSLLTPLSPAPAPAGRGAAGGGSSGRRIAYRVDLDESEGEVMEVVMRGEGNMVGAHGTGGGSRGGAANGEAAKGENGLADGTANGAGREQEEEQGGCLDLPELAFVGVKLYSIKHNKPVTTAQFLQRKRLIPVGNNPFLAADDEDTPTHDLHAPWGPAACCDATPSPPRDLVEADLRAIPRVLEAIRADWEDPRSLNRRTAAALVAMLQAKAEAAAAAGEAAGGMSRKEIDVLVTGVETSLWVGEQFAADLQNCFPQLRVVAVSANKVIGVMGNARGAISTAGFALSRLGAALPSRQAIVLALSQSGQTFPTLHATRILAKHCPGRVFVCTGMLDCKMATAVGLSLAAASAAGSDGAWCARVFHTHAGWRSAEPATVSAVACHATLTELLLHAACTLRSNADSAKLATELGAQTATGGGAGGGAGGTVGGGGGAGGGSDGAARRWVERPLGLRLSGGDVADLERMRDAVVLPRTSYVIVETLTAYRALQHPFPTPRSPLPSPLAVGTARAGDAHGMGDQLALHLPNNAPNLASTTLPLFPIPLLALPPQWALHVLETPMAWAISSLYIFIAVVFAVPIFTSIAKAIPTHSQLPSLPTHHSCQSPLPSRTTASDALLYTARALDALLFCFLPLIIALPLRILTGRDLLARLGKRTVVIADVPWVHQSLEVYVSKLFALSYWVAGLDVHGASPIDHLVHRFTHRVCRGTLLAFGRPDGRLCSQSRCESWVLMALLQARTIVSLGCGAEVITVGHNPYHARSLVKRHVVLPSNRPKFLCEKLLGVDDLEPMKRMATREHVVSTTTGKNPFEALDSQVVGLHLCDEGTVQKARKLGLSMLAHGLRDISTADAEDPGNREAILSALGGDVNHLLHSQAPIEDICENRFLSLERLIAFHVLFHRMASVVASLPPLRFNIAQSQSRLRIATTAAPVSAADLEREWLDSVADTTMHDLTLHRRTRHHHHVPLLPHPHHHHHHHHNHSYHGGTSLHIPSPFFSSGSTSGQHHSHQHQHSHHGVSHRISETLHHLLPLHLPTSHSAANNANTTPAHTQQHTPSSAQSSHTEHRVGGSYHGGGGGGGSMRGGSHHGSSHHGGFFRSILPLRSPSAASASGGFGRSGSGSGGGGGGGKLVTQSSGTGGAAAESPRQPIDEGSGAGAGGVEGSHGSVSGWGGRVSFDVGSEQSADARMRRLSVDVTPGSSLRGGMAGGVTFGPWPAGMGSSASTAMPPSGSVGSVARSRAVIGVDVFDSGAEGGAVRLGVSPGALPKVEEAGGLSLREEKGGEGSGKAQAGEGEEGDSVLTEVVRGGERKVKGGGEILRLLKET
ncbi:unnamed protein product [Closterium sp. NIES-54]